MGGDGFRRFGGAAVATALVAGLTGWFVGAQPGTSSADSAWGLAQIHAPQAWPVSTGQGITIGIVDSGIDPAAPAVVGRVGPTADCVGSGGDENLCRPGLAPDVVGHGTIVASVAAQVAPGARFVVARAVNGNTGGDDDVSAAIDWVVDHGARVVNVSIADEDQPSLGLGPRMTAAIERAWTRGAIPVLASGNTGGVSVYGTVDALVAAATTPAGTIASYSTQTTGVKWGVAAPGSIVMVLSNGTQLLHEGTSVAAPNVAGVAALLLARGEDRDSAVDKLVSTAVPCGGCGHGRIDAAAALGIPLAPPIPAPPLRPAPPPPTTTTVPPAPLAIPDPSLLDQAPGLDALAR
ncbi:MAG: S8 family serine peptidase [Acidimicrobiia bacterium]|nr:S8 family serine peptidase [Acidimicrobiia bacterium]